MGAGEARPRPLSRPARGLRDRLHVSRAARVRQARAGRPRGRLAPAIDALAHNPRPSGAVKLQDVPDGYRIRIGAYRVLYQVRDDRLLVLVVRVGHRREVYRSRP